MEHVFCVSGVLLSGCQTRRGSRTRTRLSRIKTRS